MTLGSMQDCAGVYCSVCKRRQGVYSTASYLRLENFDCVICNQLK